MSARRWSSCRAAGPCCCRASCAAWPGGTSTASTSRCARSGSSCGPTATWRSHPNATEPISKRFARGTARSRSRPTSLPRAVPSPGTRGSSSSVAATRPRCSPGSAPDGFPLAARLPVSLDPEARRIALGAEPAGLPLAEGRACLTAHGHDPDFSWRENFQVRGDLVRRRQWLGARAPQARGGSRAPATRGSWAATGAPWAGRSAITERRGGSCESARPRSDGR